MIVIFSVEDSLLTKEVWRKTIGGRKNLTVNLHLFVFPSIMLSKMPKCALYSYHKT